MINFSQDSEYVECLKNSSVDTLLHDIWELGVDYDGCKGNAEALEELVDELVFMAETASENLHKGFLYERIFRQIYPTFQFQNRKSPMAR